MGKPYSDDIRWLVVWKRLVRGKSPREVTEDLEGAVCADTQDIWLRLSSARRCSTSVRLLRIAEARAALPRPSQPPRQSRCGGGGGAAAAAAAAAARARARRRHSVVGAQKVGRATPTYTPFATGRDFVQAMCAGGNVEELDLEWRG